MDYPNTVPHAAHWNECRLTVDIIVQSNVRNILITDTFSTLIKGASNSLAEKNPAWINTIMKLRNIIK
ncbi:hypothetical protein WA026_015333, partial [Henosepilachna vigintioctopunctata]